MAKRKRKFTYSLSKTQLQLTIEALLMARSAGAHCQVSVVEESGREHTFAGIINDGTIDRLVDELDRDGTAYEIRLVPTGTPYTRSEDRSIEMTITALNASLGELEAIEEAETQKIASDAAPKLIESLYLYLYDTPDVG
jgi:hypothetical protein